MPRPSPAGVASQHSGPRSRRAPHIRVLCRLAVAAVVLAGSLTALCVVGGAVAIGEVRSGLAAAQSAARGGSPADLRAVMHHFARANAALALLAVPAGMLAHLPIPAAREGGETILLARAAGEEVSALATLSADLEAAGGRGGVGGIGPRLVELLARDRDLVSTARREAALLRARLTQFDGRGLPPSGQRLLVTMRRSVPLLVAAADLLDAAPALLGAADPRAYLVVTQNSMELRPTGGYIGACGLVYLEHGRPRLADFRSAFDVDWSLPEGTGGWPPLPLAVYEHLSHGTFRDANWSPSFPVAARALASAYARGMGRRPYGVVAINTGALAAVLDALGPLRVPGYPGALEAATAVHVIDYYSNDHVQGHAKVYLGRAADALMHRLLHLTRRDLIRLVPAMIRLLVDREVQVYVGDSRAERALAILGIDGQAGPAAGDQTDYLALVDANVGHSKINDRVREDLAYLVTLPSGAATTLRASLTITYTNTARRTTLPLYDGAPLYQDFARVLVPHGSRLLLSSGLEQPWSAAEEEGGAAWSGYLAVGPAAQRAVRFFYQEPWSGGRVRSPIYRLQVRHQSGAGPQGLEIAIIRRGRVLLRWHGTLRRDMVVSVALPSAPSG